MASTAAVPYNISYTNMMRLMMYHIYNVYTNIFGGSSQSYSACKFATVMMLQQRIPWLNKIRLTELLRAACGGTHDIYIYKIKGCENPLSKLVLTTLQNVSFPLVFFFFNILFIKAAALAQRVCVRLDCTMALCLGMRFAAAAVH